jgi:type III restriction enzyme
MEDIIRTQKQETIKTHFEKQAELKSIKVLSLFFIDKVDNYIYDDSLIRKIFEEEFEKIKKQYDFFKNKDVQKVHDGYFTKKNQKGDFMDTGGNTAKDKDTFDLIMKDKERLLSFDEDVCFIFSHSALREGWDNPNIFQICTLQATKSEMDKRQKIGRGLRLPVDKYGQRIQNQNINVLTVIANESYDEYVRSLQSEYAKSGQTVVGVENRGRKIKNKVRNEVLESEEFKELWGRISRKTKFVVEFGEKELIKDVVEKFKEKDINNLVVMVEKVYVDFANDGRLKTIYKDSYAGEKLQGDIKIRNIINILARNTNLTRKTILKIIKNLKDENLGVIFDNPEEFLRSLTIVIKNCLNEIVVNNGLKYIETGEFYKAEILFEEHLVNHSKLIETQKTVFEKTECDSEGERDFAQNMDINKEEVKLFTKLPIRFKISTPLGGYSPDWAILFEKKKENKLYLVRETKFGENRSRDEILENLRPNEQAKIKCAKKHFKTLEVDFDVTTQSDLRDLE